MEFIESFSAISTKVGVQIKDIVETEFYVEIHLENASATGATKEILARICPGAFKVINSSQGTVVKVSKINLPSKVLSGEVLEYLREDSLFLGIDGFGPVHRSKGERFSALIVGNPGKGKSSYFAFLLSQFLRTGFGKHYIIDAKGVDYGLYTKHPQVEAVLTEPEKFLECIKDIKQEMDHRATVFKEAFSNAPRSLKEYKEFRIKHERGDLPEFEDIFIWIDEAHKLLPGNPPVERYKHTIESEMEQLMRQGRAFGINVVVSTHSVNDVSGAWRRMFDNRIIFYTSSSHNYFHNGAEILQRSIPGRFAYIDDEAVEVLYIQAPLFAPQESLALGYENRFKDKERLKDKPLEASKRRTIEKDR